VSAEEFIDQVLLSGLGVRWVLVGDDFRFGARRQGDVAMLREALIPKGVEVAQMQTVALDGTRVSSTAVRVCLANGDLRGAQQLLGRPYSISGRVVGGERLGQRLGFPTANVQMKHNRPPLAGIFVVEVAGLDEQPLEGVASLGVRPTIAQGGAPVLEVHLLDFERDIYGRHLHVRFLQKLRDEQKFADLDTLKHHIARDVEDARQFFRRGRARDRRENIH